ncbi:POK18 protein, partial [Eudromia elegans]|nr:POK18 protein [Eudromia elegans]NXA44220.1 POK18 protein [Eudromia elegans]
PWKYLGWVISEGNIRPQKLSLHTELRTLNDAQKLLGDLQWLRPVVGFTNEDLEPL